MNIAENKVVAFHYTLTSENGEMIDSSKDQPPLEYLHGHRNIIQGLERQLKGKEVGEKFTVTLQSEDAYGPRDDTLVEKLTWEKITEEEDPHPGMEIEIDLEGERRRVTVVGVEGDQVTVDGNHPLAGETLVFDVEIMGIREATQEEIAHGHVHSHSHH